MAVARPGARAGVLAAAFAALLAPPGRCAVEGAAGPARPPLRLQGRHVVDAQGRRVLLACVNWYGAHLEQMAANGLNRQPLAKIAARVADFGFNCVRLPFSLDMVLRNHTQVPEPNVSLAANPELRGLTPLQVFDATVAALTAVGVMVVLNNHVSSPGWCCSLTDGEGLWYTDVYSEDDWLRGVRLMAARYRSDPLVVGFDLRNEIRPSLLGTPTWGGGENWTDWSMAAVKGAREVVAVNEGMLIIISGLYFSIFLCDVPRRPVHDMVPELRGRTLYTSHEYKWVNFHLVSRAVLGGYLATLAIWWAGLWALAALGWRLGRWRCQAGRCRRLQGGALCCCRCCGCCGRGGCRPGMQRSCELAGAVVLTASSMLLLGVTELFMDKCSLVHLVLSIAFLGLSFICCLVSLVLWMRLAVTCVQQSQDEVDWSPPSASPCQELAMHIPSSGTIHLNDFLARSRAAEDAPARPRGAGGCRLAAQSKRCLAFAVSGLLLGALACLWMLFGRYDVFAGELDSRWGFLVQGEEAQAPVWIGEFGSDVDDLWWRHIQRYIGEREVAGWAYWSLNGQRTNAESETFGLLMEDSLTVRHPWKLRALQLLAGGAAPRAAAAASAAASAAAEGLPELLA